MTRNVCRLILSWPKFVVCGRKLETSNEHIRTLLTLLFLIAPYISIQQVVSTPNFPHYLLCFLCKTLICMASSQMNKFLAEYFCGNIQCQITVQQIKNSDSICLKASFTNTSKTYNIFSLFIQLGIAF